ADVHQILGNAVARNGGIEASGIGKFGAVLRGEAAVAREGASDLAHAVGAEIESDAGVVIANGGHELAARAGANERDNKFVGHAAVIGILHAGDGIRVFRGFTVAEDHRVEGFGNALPAAIAVHGVIAAADGGDFATVVLAHFLLQLLEVAGAASGHSVAAVHEGVD